MLKKIDQNNKLHFTIYSSWEQLFEIVIIFQKFYCIFDQINAAFVQEKLYKHTEKRGFKIVPFGVQQLVAGAVPLKGHICTFFTPNRYILVP